MRRYSEIKPKTVLIAYIFEVVICIGIVFTGLVHMIRDRLVS